MRNERRGIKGSLVIFLCLAGLSSLANHAVSQESAAPATGFALWVRVPVTSARNVAASFVATPEFAVGYRGERYGIGVGLGLVVGRASDDYETLSGTVFQIGPSGWIEFWQSPDARTRGSVALGLNAGRISYTDDYTNYGEDKFTGTLMSFYAGLGADHFLSPHFALGAEGGFQGTFGFDFQEEGDPEQVSASASGLYGLLRVMFVY